MTDKTEVRIERRAHWAQLAIGGIIAATVYCVTMKLNLIALEDEFRQYKKDMKTTIKELDSQVDEVSHHEIEDHINIDWLKKGGH